MKLEVLNSDPFNAPTPGQSLTDTPGQGIWEQPAQLSDPVEAFEKVLASLQDPLTLETVSKLMYVGVSIETILNGIMVKMFSEGVFTPDIAEIINPPLVAYITEMGVEAGIEDINVVNNLPSSSIGTEEHMDLMQKVSPQKFERIANNAVQEEEFDEMLLNMEIPDEPMQSPRESFLDMEVE